MFVGTPGISREMDINNTVSICNTSLTRKNQAVRSKTGPEIGRYGKVNQKLERYDIVPFRSRVTRKTDPQGVDLAFLQTGIIGVGYF